MRQKNGDVSAKVRLNIHDQLVHHVWWCFAGQHGDPRRVKTKYILLLDMYLESEACKVS